MAGGRATRYSVEQSWQQAMCVAIKAFDTLRRRANFEPVARHQGRLKPVAVLGRRGQPRRCGTAATPARRQNSHAVGHCHHGFGWKPNQWALNPAPHLRAQSGGFIEWYRSTRAGRQAPSQGQHHHVGSHACLRRHGQGLQAHKAHPDKKPPSWGHLDRGAAHRRHAACVVCAGTD